MLSWNLRFSKGIGNSNPPGNFVFLRLTAQNNCFSDWGYKPRPVIEFLLLPIPSTFYEVCRKVGFVISCAVEKELTTYKHRAKLCRRVFQLRKIFKIDEKHCIDVNFKYRFCSAILVYSAALFLGQF